MTDDNSEKDTNTILILGLALVAVLIILVLVLLVLLPVFVAMFPEIILFLPDSGGTQFDCTPMEEVDEEYRVYVNETWIESDEIRGYEDIPERERRGLSESAKRYLRDSARVDYTPRYYRNLSGKEKRLFTNAIEANDSIGLEKYNLSREGYRNLSWDDMRYNGTTYECRELRDEDA